MAACDSSNISDHCNGWDLVPGLRILIGSLVCYSLGKVICYLYPELNLTMFRFYFGDVLAPMVIVPIGAFLQRVIYRRVNLSEFSVAEVLIYWMVMSAFFEVVAPRVFSKMTSDPFDVIAYAIGSILLLLFSRFSLSSLYSQLTRSMPHKRIA